MCILTSWSSNAHLVFGGVGLYYVGPELLGGVRTDVICSFKVTARVVQISRATLFLTFKHLPAAKNFSAAHIRMSKALQIQYFTTHSNG